MLERRRRPIQPSVHMLSDATGVLDFEVLGGSEISDPKSAISNLRSAEHVSLQHRLP